MVYHYTSYCPCEDICIRENHVSIIKSFNNFVLYENYIMETSNNFYNGPILFHPQNNSYCGLITTSDKLIVGKYHYNKIADVLDIDFMNKKDDSRIITKRSLSKKNGLFCGQIYDISKGKQPSVISIKLIPII